MMRKIAFRLTVLCALHLCWQVHTHLSADDWPQFLGPHSDGTSAETGLIDGWGKGGPRLLWKKEIGPGYSAPSIRKGKLVLHHRRGKEEVIECLDPETGTAIWNHKYPSDFVDPYGYNNGPRCSPLLTEDHCFTFGAEGKLVCLDLKTGSKIWERDTAKDWKIPQAFFGVGSTPILESNLLIVMVGGQPNSGVVAFSPRTGETVWESVGKRNWQGKPMIGWPGELQVDWRDYEKQASYATPVVATLHGKRRVLCLMRQGLVALDPSSGAVDDSFWFRSRLNDSVNASNPVVFDNRIFISGAYYKCGSVYLDVDPATRRFKEIWRTLDIETHWMTPILHKGVLYAFSGRNEPDARFRCFDLATGKLKWDRDESWVKRSDEPPQTFGRGSIILADNKLIVLGEAGMLGMFKPNPSAPEELCRFQSPLLRYPCWAGPILSNKRLYLRSEDILVCYDFSKPPK